MFLWVMKESRRLSRTVKIDVNRLHEMMGVSLEAMLDHYHPKPLTIEDAMRQFQIHNGGLC